jgi:hypothetical protein
VALRLPSGHVHIDKAVWIVKSNGLSPPGPPGKYWHSGTIPPGQASRHSGAEGLGTARFNTPVELKKRPTRRVWALVQLRPLTHHPDQPAAHTAFQTHWARLVSNMGHRSPHLWACYRCPFSPLPRQHPPGGAARGSHTGQFSCFGPRSPVASSHSYWT